MKTIAIDEATLKLLDKLTESSSRRRSRTALVRAALRQYAQRERRQTIEAKDAAIFRKHRKRLALQNRALVSEQARP
jgi:predicted transcriptional regulator